MLPSSPAGPLATLVLPSDKRATRNGVGDVAAATARGIPNACFLARNNNGLWAAAATTARRVALAVTGQGVRSLVWPLPSLLPSCHLPLPMIVEHDILKESPFIHS